MKWILFLIFFFIQAFAIFTSPFNIQAQDDSEYVSDELLYEQQTQYLKEQPSFLYSQGFDAILAVLMGTAIGYVYGEWNYRNILDEEERSNKKKDSAGNR